MTPERLRELKEIYRRAVVGATPRQTEDHWHRFLAALWKEDGDPRIFVALRHRARLNGARIDEELLAGTKTPREVFALIRERCADVYASGLNRYGVAMISITSPAYQRLTRDMAIEVLQAFKGVDPADRTAVCVAMAKTWHQFVRHLHTRYGLPSPRDLKTVTDPESDAEKAVIESDDFTTSMTSEERADWEAVIADDGTS